MSGASDPSRNFGLPEGYFEQNTFLADDFIEEISRVDIEFGRKNALFEPKPFVRTFERALDKLLAAQSDLEANITRLEGSAGACAEDHRKKMARLKQTFATVGSSFEKLETQISEVSSNTIRIGEQLDTVAKEKDRAEAIKELVEFYAELNEGDTRHLDELLEGGSEGMVKVAHTLRRLNTIIVDNEYSAPADAKAKRQIEIYSENFEKTVLGTFEAAYRDGDVHNMSVSARTLDAFNGGVSVVKAYINQHPFFLSSMISQSQDSIAEASYQSMEGVSDINHLPPPPDRWLVQLYADTRSVMFKDWAIVSKVFPRPIEIMQQLLKRVFEQTIQSYLETLFSRAEGQSKLAFLRVLASSHLETRKLVEDLQRFDAETITPAVMVLDEGDNAGVGLLHGFLNRCCDDLFESYIAGGNYMSAEQAHLREAFRQTLVPFVRVHAERQGPSRGKALLGMISSVTGGVGTTSGNAGGGLSAMHGGIAGTSTAGPNSSNSAAGGVPAESERSINTSIARMLLQVHAEAIARAVELESDAAAPDAVAALTSQLISTLGDEYVFPALEDALESLQDLRQEPDMAMLGVIRMANVVVRLLQIHFQRAIVPFVGNGNYIYRDIVAEKNQLMSRVELSLNLITNKLIGVCTQWIGSILGKQRKGDFRPAEDDFTAFEMGTQPCRQCTDFLRRVEQACQQNLGTENQERVLADVGNALHRVLMEHLRKYVVSIGGGLVLAKDVSRYREVITSFGVPALNDKFAVLQDISNIFLVQPTALKSLLDEGPLSRLDRATLQAFVQMREDSRSSSLVKQFM
ncbi:exocyst complex component Sec10 [Coemansia reversa NRRL 1564]|uniref:Exocyst complex component Sec10 n=1 Tax=Coemansia reversa (strain ATCC 12441 / NRRL 1564) TaxID=763665 RepID=A0A2G5BGI7_COERN|nr:exocyst complex component Sec10 [Coemansia reversa NRRL 1564]|eukprot:PIA17817.1 exocyst complex component Sec10 [Coemansia reversa NRRL 1564]